MVGEPGERCKRNYAIRGGADRRPRAVGGFANAAGWLQRLDAIFTFLRRNQTRERRMRETFSSPRANLLSEDVDVILRLLFSCWIPAVRKTASTS